MRYTDFEGRPNLNTQTTVVAFTDTASTLAGLGVSFDSATKFVVVSIENNDVRYCPEGTAPTNSGGTPASRGHLGSAGSNPILLSRGEADEAKWINAVLAAAGMGQVSQYLR